MQEIAYAKINLALHVRARRDDGYHVLETLFAFAEDGDILTAELADGLSLNIDGPFSVALEGGADNLVMRAARAVQEAFAVTHGAAIILDKRLPVAAGIGGGSADAAAALRLLARLWGLDIQHPKMMEIAAALGADVPACLESRTVRGEGVGDVLIPVAAPHLTGLPVLLINDFTPCLTGPVFAGWDGVDRGPLDQDVSIKSIIAARNDLVAPAAAIVPQIQPLLESLRAQDGVIMARMSGSGATCFALFDTPGNCHGAGMAFRDIWYLATRLR